MIIDEKFQLGIDIEQSNRLVEAGSMQACPPTTGKTAAKQTEVHLTDWLAKACSEVTQSMQEEHN
ncbi:MAG: hypothetical protein JAY97_03810 [Candidatus Thiodiazotropha sp. 'RUGA']|nr:hypothetical protein [Candidatus Thiodiazotropha sp. 'RUGA']